MVGGAQHPEVGHRLHGPGVGAPRTASCAPSSWPPSAAGCASRSGTCCCSSPATTSPTARRSAELARRRPGSTAARRRGSCSPPCASSCSDDVMPGTTGRLSFHARVAANVVAMLERELAIAGRAVDRATTRSPASSPTSARSWRWRTRATSRPGEPRLAPLEEGGDALAVVVGLEALLQERRRAREVLAGLGHQGAVDELLRAGDGERRAGEEALGLGPAPRRAGRRARRRRTRSRAAARPRRRGTRRSRAAAAPRSARRAAAAGTCRRPVSATSPRRTKFHANRARRRGDADVALRRELGAHADGGAVDGGDDRLRARHQRPRRSAPRRRPRPDRSDGGVASRSARSVPAQKAPPAPVRITARASPSSPARAMASWNSASTAHDMALRFSGRSIVMVATPPSTS